MLVCEAVIPLRAQSQCCLNMILAVPTRTGQVCVAGKLQLICAADLTASFWV